MLPIPEGHTLVLKPPPLLEGCGEPKPRHRNSSGWMLYPPRPTGQVSAEQCPKESVGWVCTWGRAGGRI